MTRGRKKDLTIPPTRSLAQQRDYRARKAQYVSDLENRCKATEAENIRLRREVELAKGGISSLLSVEAAQAYEELIEKLGEASVCLTRLQQLALSTKTSLSPSASFVSSDSSQSSISSSFTASNLASNQTRVSTWDGSNIDLESLNRHWDHPRSTLSPTPSLGSNCCGGLMDCRLLVEEDDSRMDHRRLEQQKEAQECTVVSRERTSGLRSTADDTCHGGSQHSLST